MYRIIIADDEEYVRELIASNINRSQKAFQVIAKAGNGREAMELVEKLQPDILIADICMPFINGLELIRGIRQKAGNTKTVIISGYDDFSYAKQALSLGVTDYLLKPFSPEELYEVLDKIRDELESKKALMNNIREMKNQLEDANRLFQEHVVQKLVHRSEKSPQLLEEANRAGIFPEGLFCAAGMFQIYQNDREQVQDIKELLAVTIPSYFQKKCQVYLAGIHEGQMEMIFLGDYQNKHTFRKEIEKGITAILESLRHYYDIWAGCVIGGIYSDWNQISESYQNILSIWKKQHENAETVLFFDDEVLKYKGNTGFLERPKKSEQELLMFIQTGQMEKAEKCLDDILHYYEKLNVNWRDFVSVSLAELVFDISDIMKRTKIQGKVWEDENVIGYFREHFAYGTLQDAYEMILAYVQKCCGQFAQMNETQSERIVFQVKELVEDNLDNEEFCLEMVAESLLFSYSYIRQIFKQATGESFMEYLIRRRMEKARELLKNENLKIQEIAVQTGYSNQRYFASCFKKYFGCTPTECRLRKEI